MMYESAKLYFLCGLKNLSNEFLGLRPEKIIKKSEVLSNDGKVKRIQICYYQKLTYLSLEFLRLSKPPI